MKKRRISPGYTIVYLFLVLWALTTIFPLVWSVMNSFKNKKMIYQNSFSFPLGEAFSLENYRNIFANYNLFSAYRNSLIISGSVAFAVILLSGMAAYILCRYQFHGKKLLTMLLYAGMMFPIYSTIIPVMRMQAGWGIVNSPSVGANLLSVILPQIAGNMSFAIIVLTSLGRPLGKGIPWPTLKDLDPYCPDAEDFADKIILLHQPLLPDFCKETDDKAKELLIASVDLNRKGRTGSVCLSFDQERIRVETPEEGRLAAVHFPFSDTSEPGTF